MEKFTVTVTIPETPKHSYDIIIGAGTLSLAKNLPAKRRYAVITDTNVELLYAEKLLGILSDKNIKNDLYTISPGEKNKTRASKEELEDAMLEEMHDRKSAVIALGGGVVGDLAGFTASTFMRGIPIIQIPTTLLAMVDSSIGGKTAIDTPLGKNLIGTFHQPELVLIDTDTLKTLPKREIQNGIAEIIKHSVIRDRDMFSELECSIEKLLDMNSGYPIDSLIENNCRIKADVVMNDEREGGLRRILNFGHTAGHAVETLSEGRLNHGEAVAVGMIIEAKTAVLLDMFSIDDANRLITLVARAGMDIHIPKGMSPGEILKSTKHDKKAQSGSVKYSLPDALGSCQHGVEAEDSVVLAAIEECLR